MKVAEGSTPPRPGNVAGYEALARESLPRSVYDYYAGGAEDEWTVRANREAFAQYALRPRVLVDVTRMDTTVRVLDDVIDFPVMLAPAAFQRLAHTDGEIATARAAAAVRTVKIASTLSTYPIEEIAAAAPDAALWFQLYVFRDRSITEELVRRAEAAGCRAICLTASVAVQGNRERDAHNQFQLPVGVEMANFRGMRQATFPEARGSGLLAFISAEFDDSLTWEALAWLRSITQLPVVIKGIMSPLDARLAVEHGAAGVIVSNHGGRQLDGAEATLRALPRVAEAVADRVPVLMDGGVRRGTDVVKALLLGARAVLIARPYLWGLSVGGQEGVTHVLEILRDEVRRTLALLGAPSLAHLDAEHLAPGLGSRPATILPGRPSNT
ncbi:MAG TPA: alpha-hydroxy acid oxidase [Longimicrobiales bacterium]|nr:alpha-hydroxy acid oxidase [Longimicrobiales bacterium]